MARIDDPRLREFAIDMVNRLHDDLRHCGVEYRLAPVGMIFGSNDLRHGELRVPVCVIVDGDDDMKSMQMALWNIAKQWSSPMRAVLDQHTDTQDPTEGNQRAVYISLRHQV